MEHDDDAGIAADVDDNDVVDAKYELVTIIWLVIQIMKML